jgi:hypothetical protein
MCHAHQLTFPISNSTNSCATSTTFCHLGRISNRVPILCHCYSLGGIAHNGRARPYCQSRWVSCSRVIHFFIFLYLMRLERADWVLEQASQTLSNWIMVAYAYHLLSGNTVHCRSIKAATVKKYLLDVAVFLCRFRDTDPHRVRQWDDGLCPVGYA